MSICLLSHGNFSRVRFPLPSSGVQMVHGDASRATGTSSSDSYLHHSTGSNSTGSLWLRFRRASVILLTMLLATVVIVMSGCGAAGSHAAAKILASPESAASQTLSIATAALPVASVDGPYDTVLLATGGVPPYSWVKTSGQLPNGLTLNSSTGAISGTPTTAGSFSFGAKVVDSGVDVVATDFSLNVSTAPKPVVLGASPNSGSSNGGTLVTINGKNFDSELTVAFGNIPAQSIRVVNATQVQAVTPVEGSGTVAVTLQESDGQVATVANAFTFTTPAENPNAATAVNADVVVDAGQTLSETGGDDLAAAKNIYSSASAPESDGDLYPDWNLISSQFAMKRMRNINGLGDCALNQNGALTGCSRLNNDLQNMKQFGLTPHVIVGQWAPASIGGTPLRWGSSQWAQYDALCYAIVDYVSNHYGGSGFSEALFEVENEIDTTTIQQDLWLTTSPNVGQGDPSRFSQFDTVYAHWAKAVDAVAKRSPSKKIRIAGPSTGFWTATYGNGQIWQSQIVQKYAAQNIRLDVVSIHQYGDCSNLAKYAQNVRQTLNESGKAGAEIWVTEWGASEMYDNVMGAINASNAGAAWAIDFLLQALKGGVTGGSFLEVRDNAGHDTAGVNSNINAATWNHVMHGAEYPKAVSNAFSMIDRMSGQRKSAAVNAQKPDLYALASASQTSGSLVVANYNYTASWANKSAKDISKNETVTVAFKNLAFDGPVTVDRYLIDSQTSNVNYWVSNGKIPSSVQITQLQKVESFSANSTGGVVSLPARPLGPSAVSLWIIHQ
jgi:hypothetical protein